MRSALKFICAARSALRDMDGRRAGSPVGRCISGFVRDRPQNELTLRLSRGSLGDDTLAPPCYPQLMAMQVASASAVGAFADVAAVENPPKVVFLLAHDVDYGDLACLGNPIIKTRHLDALHAESILSLAKIESAQSATGS